MSDTMFGGHQVALAQEDLREVTVNISPASTVFF